MRTKCYKCARKAIEIIVYLIAGYICGGCSNTGTCVLHTNVLNAYDPTSNVSTNNVYKE